MASNNTTRDEVLALFPDNTNYEITAEDLRTYVNAIFSDKEVVILKLLNLSMLGANNTHIYEGSLVVIYGDADTSKIGIYLSKINQPIGEPDLIQLSSLSGAGAGAFERGGLVYDESKYYLIGDIVSESSTAYICITNTPAPTGAFDSNLWVQIGAGGVTVVDNLTSTSTTAVLSANMGRELQDTKEPNLPNGTGNGGYILTLGADEVTREWQPTTSRAIEWSIGIMYGVNNLVAYEGFMYKSIQTHSGQQPDISPAYWEHVFVEEAPQDGSSYWRKDGTWSDTTDYGGYT